MEADGLMALSQRLDDEFVRAVETLLSARGRVIVAGVGKSGHVARKIAATFASTGTPAHFVHPTEASHGDLGMISAEDVVLALSKSGETAELSDVIHYTRRFAIPLIAVTAHDGSALGRAGDIRLILPDAPEACGETNAPTTSTTLMMALGDALAVALLERRGFRATDFKLYHPGGRLGSMLLSASDIMHAGNELPLVLKGSRLAEGIESISQKGFGCVGVTDEGGRLIGLITDGDLRRHLASGAVASTVEEVMTSRPMTLPADTLAAAILRRMQEKKITQIFIVDGDRPVGLVHMHDLLRAGIA
jgi:arabinose-5-phosphate isomerase